MLVRHFIVHDQEFRNIWMNPDEMTADQVLRWKAAWENVNRFEIEELRTADTTTKIRQLASMMASYHLFESEAERAANVEIARRRWLELYRAYGY